MNIEKAAKQLEALDNPTRLEVYRALVRDGDPGLPVGRLQTKLDIAASTLSHNLHRLILTGLVTQERQTTTLICRANLSDDGQLDRLPLRRVLRRCRALRQISIFWNYRMN